jgi:hypothetical protein
MEITIADVLKKLRDGTRITLTTRLNKHNDELSDTVLYMNSEQLFEMQYINCISSSDLGLGRCPCLDHPSITMKHVTPDEALKLIQQYVFTHNEAEKNKEAERQQIRYIFETFANI